MSIWYKNDYTLSELNDMGNNTMAQTLGMEFIEIGEDYLKLKMPVNQHTHQPYGILHGGASAALAETVGSVASSMCINNEKQVCVGMEINCNHVRPKRDGNIVATALPLHLGATSHIWDIRITDENNKLVCISRLTMAILKKRQDQV
ncbi:MAG: PaaI family thioesterase [Taibaiella sp.]|jgi:1,4-dihydroxy-2-naphthoyl-CoA hydrolase